MRAGPDGALHSAADYRNLAIIYAALPDEVQTVGVPALTRYFEGSRHACTVY